VTEQETDTEQPTEQVVEPSAQGEVVLEDEDHLAPGQTEMPVGDEIVIDDVTMRRALEAILMVTDEPLPVLTLARTVGRPTADVTAALAGLSDEYTEQGRGFDLREVGGGWRYYTREEAALYVERFVLDGQQARLTQAALETLAVVAYKQPVSRARVSAVRGVNVDGVMRTLISRGLVEEAGADTESQATLYRTTSYFLERMGMQSLDDLPELAPYLPEMDDMEEELAAHNNPHPDTTADADSEAADGALEPAEELEAGGETELEQEESDPAEIPEADEPAETDEDESEDDLEDVGSEDLEEHGDPATGVPDEDEFDEDDESQDEQLEPAEDLEAAGGELEESVPLTDETPLDDPASGSPEGDGATVAADGDAGSGGGEDASAAGHSQYRVSDE
jgi:segregation and condensation protein B